MKEKNTPNPNAAKRRQNKTVEREPSAIDMLKPKDQKLRETAMAKNSMFIGRRGAKYIV